MKKSRTSLCLLFMILLIPGCYLPGGPVPEEPVSPEPRAPIDQRVTVEEDLIYSPYPRDNGEIPGSYICDWDCDYIRFIRYRPTTSEGVLIPFDDVVAVLVLIPGYMGGANSFDHLGRQLVSMAEAGGRGSIEVWAIDRRGNCLEDLTGMNAAEASGDLQDAVDYYYNGAELSGHTFQGFLSDEDVPFLSEFGLQLLMEDLYTIITTKIPNQNDRKNKVFIGGHSMGGSLTSYFAGWDFDGNAATKDDAGFNNCAGLIGMDGRVGIRSGSYIEEETYSQRLADIRSGAATRLNLYMGVTPEALSLFEILGMGAHMFPNDEATIFQEIPYSKDVANLIRLLHSRNLGHFLTGIPSIKDFRYTNEALLGVFFDDNLNPASILQASMGFLHGGPIVQKHFPGDLADLLGIWGIKKDGVFIPWDAGPPLDLGSGALYSWVNFDEVGDASDPDYKDTTGTLTYTTWTEEVTDIQDVARSLYQGPTNFPEWYFTSRISLDTQAASAPYNSDYGLYFLHNDRIEDVPMINFNASDHEGYNHQDVIFAAVDRPARPNLVFEGMLEFVYNSGGLTP